MGIIPPADDEMKTSSAYKNSAVEMARVSVFSCSFSAISSTVFRVIPAYTPCADGSNVLPVTADMLKPDPSVTRPFASVKIAVSTCFSLA
jgi:hypothetical protein